MREQLLQALAARQEVIDFEGHRLVVREIPHNEDLADFRQGDENAFRLLVRSVYTEAGERVFSDADIPALKQSSKRKIVELQEAIARVNGWSAEHEVKNSEAAPSSG